MRTATLWSRLNAAGGDLPDREDRHRDRLEELIGKDFGGIVGSDRWWAYDLIDPESRQVCWEHLKRDFFKHSEGLAEQKEFGTPGLGAHQATVQGLARLRTDTAIERV